MRLSLLNAHWSDATTIVCCENGRPPAATDAKPVIVPDCDILGIEKLQREKM